MRQVAIIILIFSLAFFLAGLYEWSKAKESAHWPARTAKITLSEVRKGSKDEGSWVAIDGVFADTGGAFSVRRYAYGVINGMSPGQKYLARYKPGVLTTVYVDPKDSSNVILCNAPSLAFQYSELAVTAGLILASVWYLIFRRKKTGAREPVRTAIPISRTIELPQWAGVLIGMAMALLFLGLGIWMIHMGVVRHSPAEKWSPGQAKIVILMGVLFAFGGIQAAVKVIWGNSLSKTVDKIMLSLFLVFLGLPFITIPIFDPGGISSSTSINGMVVHEAKGSSVGAVVFMLVGVLCLVGALWPWRWWKKNR
jgi:hypothetical protein